MVSKIDLEGSDARRYRLLSLVFILLHVFFMLYRYGSIPLAPVLVDEVIVNDASISLAQGHGYVASSFGDSQYGLDHVFAHFPPVYPFVAALAFRLFGVSVYSLRLTTTVMSIGTTVVLFFLLYRLCRLKLLNWNAAVLINAIYCTNASLITQERMARMESMIGFLVVVAFWFVFHAVTTPSARGRWLAMGGAGVCGALAVAVHPEAITALLLLTVLMLFVVPVSLKVKAISVGMIAALPVVVGLAVFGSSLFVAVAQFLRIVHDAHLTESTTWDWLWMATHHPSPGTMNRNFLLILIMLLLMAAPMLYAVWGRRLERSSLGYRLSASLAIVAIVEVALMVFAFHMDDRRCQFLLAPLLLCYGLILHRARPLPRWQMALGGLFVCLQCFVVGAYFEHGRDPVDMNSDRYLAVIARLPQGASIAANPGLWLDLKESGRPFNLIYYGMDGENVWIKKHANPLDRFDVVILEDIYAVGREWWIQEAQEGRRKYSYRIGSEVVDVYVRNGIDFHP